MSQRIDLTEAPLPPARRPRRGGGGRGTGVARLDEAAHRLVGPAAVVSALLTLYLLWGLWGGAWSHQAMGLLPAPRRQEQVANIALVFRLLQGSALVTVAALLVSCAQAEGVGYWLLGAAALLYAGPPFVTAPVYPLRGWTASRASQAALADFQALAWLLAVPGVLWSVVDVVRRVRAAADLAAVQRANARYGTAVPRQAASPKHRQVFLGRCWEGPFCRDHIRAKCPVFLEKRGPCWRRKEGCMCEERIVLQAMIAPDWKDQMTRANLQLSMGSGARKALSPEAKRERCRNCVIYNEHQRQKYKALTGLTLVAVPTLLALNFAWLQGLVDRMLFGLDAATKRFSLDANTTGITVLHNGAYSLIAWVFVLALGLVLLSQALKVIEYFCLKLKI